MHRKAPADTPTRRSSEARQGLFNSLEARVYLGGISESTFRRITARRDGQPPKLRTVKQGAFVYVEQDALDEYIAGLRTQAAAELQAA
jgi:hypothetical protein